MAILGLLLLAAAVVVGTELALSNQSRIAIEVFGTYSAVPVSVVFLVGAALATLALLGLFMITGTLQRKRHAKTTAKHRMQQQETESRLTDYDQTTAELVAENDRLRAELASERRAAATMGGVAVPPGAGDVAYGDQVSDAVRSDTISDTGRFDPYPTEHGTDQAVNTEAVRHDGTADNDTVRTNGVNGMNGTENTHDKAGVVGRFRGNH